MIMRAALATSALTLVAGAASAQTSDADAAEAAPVIFPEVITVTARKREEGIIETPVAVTVFGVEDVERIGVNDLKDVKQFVPSLHFSNRANFTNQFTLRGVGGTPRHIGFENGVGVFLDGVYLGRNNAASLDLLDIASIQVLRGPQGTLFGKNTIGGAIVVTSQSPGEDASTQSRLTVGNYNAVKLEVTSDIPLSDNLFLKVSGNVWDRDGYIDNPIRNEKIQEIDRKSVRGQLRWLASDNLELNLRADYFVEGSRAKLSQTGNDEGVLRGVRYDRPESGYAGLSVEDIRFIDESGSPLLADSEIGGVSLTADYALSNGGALTSISAFRTVDNRVLTDADAFEERLVDVSLTDDSTIYSQELRYSSPSGGRLSYVAGLFAFQQEASQIRFTFQNGTGIEGIGQESQASIDTLTLAAFLNSDFAITDQLDLLVGGRIDYEEKIADYANQRPGVTPPIDIRLQDLELEVTEPSWTLGLNYAVTDTISSYFTYSRGFKSGGFNVDPINALPAVEVNQDLLDFDPETLDTFEIGLKGLNGGLYYSLAVFFSQYQDIQFTEFFSDDDGNFGSRTGNAGEAEIAGIEAEVRYDFTEQFTVFANGSLLDSEYTDSPDADNDGVGDLNGNEIARTPGEAFNVGFEYGVPVEFGRYVVSADAGVKGEIQLQDSNDPRFAEDGYTFLNARAGYETSDGRYSFFLWGKNITDEVWVDFARDFAGNRQVVFNEPRTYGATLTVNW